MTRRLMHSFWCGAFPQFALLTPAEDALREEKGAMSEAFFGSDAFSALRTTLRLKLQETPPVTQSRRASAAHYGDLIELCERYKAFAVALLRYAHYANDTLSSSSSAVGTMYSPLFFGFAGVDLRSDRLVGKERRLAYTAPVDVVLVLVLLGQLHALQAEALANQGLKLQSEAVVAASDASWRSSGLFFMRAASVASATTAAWVAGDPQLASVVKFLTSVSAQSVVLARLTQIHRTASSVACLILVDDTIERVSRHASVCARYAYTVAHAAREAASRLDDSALSRQLSWLIQSYAIRWRAIVYSYEQTVFQLDCNSGIAIHFNDFVQHSERLPALPAYPHKTDAYFTRLALELQQSHTAHMNESLEERTTLLALCQRKYGPLWTFQLLPRELSDELARVLVVDWAFCDEDDADAHSLAESQFIEEAFGVEAIDRHVRHARERADLASLSAFATSATGDREARKPTATDSKGSSKRTRPSSAGAKAQLALRKSQSTASSSDWVTMPFGDRVLTFEPLPSPSPSPAMSRRPLTAGAAIQRRRNAVPMVLDELSPTADAQRRCARPSSSPSYLTSASTTRKRTCEAGGVALTWVPTRAACALCERRYERQNLPGVVVMKRIFDLRRKWGMVLQDSKKFSAASALYGRASVCTMCQDILTFEDDKDDSLWNNGTASIAPERPLDDVGRMILSRIERTFHLLPPSSGELLLDVAVNKRARQSSTNFGLSASNAVLAEPLRTAHTKDEFQPWWELDLGNYYVVHSVKLWLREDTSHVVSYSGAGGASSTLPHRKMAVDVPANAIPLSAVGFLQSGAGQGLSYGALSPAPQPNVGLYPLHVTVSMKTGVGRDFDDVIASAVASHAVAAKAAPPVTWLTPPNCRGRFVRIQAASVAFLHIEKVNVFVAQELPTPAAKIKRENARRQLKRVAFRVSAISKRLVQGDGATTSGGLDVPASPSAKHVDHSPHPHSRGPKGFASAFADPEQAEKRRISRLYLKFKSLLDARTTVEPDERQAALECE